VLLSGLMDELIAHICQLKACIDDDSLDS